MLTGFCLKLQQTAEKVGLLRLWWGGWFWWYIQII